MNIKIVCVGDESVGKSTIINNCINDTYQMEYNPTIGIDLFNFLYKNSTNICHCHIWDTSGNEKCLPNIPAYIKVSNICLIFYDITSRNTFLNLDKWLNLIADNNPLIFLIGNKNDLEEQREVSTDEASGYAKSHNTYFLETSVKSENNFFAKIIDTVIPVIEEQMRSPKYIQQLLEENNQSLKYSKNLLENIKRSLKENQIPSKETMNTLKRTINRLIESKKSLEERQNFVKRSQNSKECQKSLDKGINSLIQTLILLQKSKTILQKTFNLYDDDDFILISDEDEIKSIKKTIKSLKAIKDPPEILISILFSLQYELSLRESKIKNSQVDIESENDDKSHFSEEVLEKIKLFINNTGNYSVEEMFSLLNEFIDSLQEKSKQENQDFKNEVDDLIDFLKLLLLA